MAMGVETRGALYGEVENGPQTELLVKKKKKKRSFVCFIFFKSFFRWEAKKCEEEVPRRSAKKVWSHVLVSFSFFFFFFAFLFWSLICCN